jgi:biopolymer transport protein ExbD
MKLSHRARSETSGLAQASQMPMINLVFLLLLYFLVTLAQKTQEGMLETETPGGQGAVAEAEEELEEEPAIIRIVRAADGVGIFFRDWPVAGWSDLGRQLRGVDKETPLILEAAPDVPFRDVVRAHNIALKSGHRNVVYTFPPV